jgi:FkbM family methyltransferase
MSRRLSKLRHWLREVGGEQRRRDAIGFQRQLQECRERIAELDRNLESEIEKSRRLEDKLKSLSEKLPGVTTLRDADYEYKFVYHTVEEKRRAERLFTKEPGTIKWLTTTLRAGDVFFDIGANIGSYTIFAGHRIGSTGVVYGFEPHLPNAISLLKNIEANSFRDRVRMIAIPLSDKDAFEEFQYFSLNPSRAHSQLGRSDLRGEQFDPAATELKHGWRLDSFINSGTLPIPNVIKIDVDGLEPEILSGMSELLRSPQRPRSIQIEVGEDAYQDIGAHMERAGYVMVERHWTESGRRRLDADPRAELPYNAIFEPNAR